MSSVPDLYESSDSEPPNSKGRGPATAPTVSADSSAGKQEDPQIKEEEQNTNMSHIPTCAGNHISRFADTRPDLPKSGASNSGTVDTASPNPPTTPGPSSAASRLPVLIAERYGAYNDPRCVSPYDLNRSSHNPSGSRNSGESKGPVSGHGKSHG